MKSVIMIFECVLLSLVSLTLTWSLYIWKWLKTCEVLGAFSFRLSPFTIFLWCLLLFLQVTSCPWLVFFIPEERGEDEFCLSDEGAGGLRGSGGHASGVRGGAASGDTHSAGGGGGGGTLRRWSSNSAWWCCVPCCCCSAWPRSSCWTEEKVLLPAAETCAPSGRSGPVHPPHQTYKPNS